MNQDDRQSLCPQCGAALQRLSGADGWAIDPCIAFGSFRIIEVKRLHAVYACTRCEYAIAGAPA